MNRTSQPLWLVRGVFVWIVLPASAVPLLSGWLVPSPRSAEVTFSAADLIATLAQRWAPLLLISAAATWLAHGADCVAGLRFALGLPEERVRAARRSLSTAARTVVWTGLALALLPFLGLVRFAAGADSNPVFFAAGISGVPLLSMGVILFGRIALASAADRAAALDGEPGRRVFPGWQDLGLYVLLLTSALSLLMMFLHFPPLEAPR